MKFLSKVPFKSLAATAATLVIFATPNANAGGFCDNGCAAVGATVQGIVYSAVMAGGAAACTSAANAAANAAAQAGKDGAAVGAAAANALNSCFVALSANAKVTAQIEGDQAYGSCMGNCTQTSVAAPAPSALGLRNYQLA